MSDPRGSGIAVSVIVPAYNTADYISESLASILNQQGVSFEVLVVDDGSTDRTPEVVRAIKDPRLRYLRRENSGGPAAPRNLGIREAHGELISFFDSDDLMAPGKLAFQSSFMGRHDVVLCATNFRRFVRNLQETTENFLKSYPRFNALKRRLGNDLEFVIPAPEALNLLFHENFIGTSSVMARRHHLLAAGLFDQSLQSGDDHDMWFRLARLGNVGFLDTVGHYYRMRTTGISLGSRKKVYLNRIRVMRKQLLAKPTYRQRRQALRLIAGYWLGLGYEYKEEGNISLAQDSFRNSLLTCMSSRGLCALASTWFPGVGREVSRILSASARK